MTISEWLEPTIYNLMKPLMDLANIPPARQVEMAKDGSTAITGVALGRAVIKGVDYTTDGWFNNLLKLAGGLGTFLAALGAYATGNTRLGQEALITSAVLTEGWVEDLIEDHIEIVASAQRTIEAAKRGDIGRIGVEMANKRTLATLSKLIGKTPATVKDIAVSEEVEIVEEDKVNGEEPSIINNRKRLLTYSELISP